MQHLREHKKSNKYRNATILGIQQQEIIYMLKQKKTNSRTPVGPTAAHQSQTGLIPYTPPPSQVDFPFTFPKWFFCCSSSLFVRLVVSYVVFVLSLFVPQLSLLLWYLGKLVFRDCSIFRLSLLICIAEIRCLHNGGSTLVTLLNYAKRGRFGGLLSIIKQTNCVLCLLLY